MNFIDILFIIPIAYAAYKGFKHGFVLELFTLLAILVGIYVGIHFSDYAANWLKTTFNWNSEYIPVVAFTITFLGVGAMIYFAGKVLEKMIKVVQLSPVNKGFGILFATLKMLYILSVLLVLIESYDEKSDFFPKEKKESSLLYYPIKDVSIKTVPALAESTIFIKNTLQPTADSTGMTVEQIIRAKEVADSLGIDAEDAKSLLEIHQQYVEKK